MEYDETMLPCPFCGSDAYTSYYCDSVLVHCCGCGCYFIVNAINMTKEDAKQRVIEKWNRRTKNV